MFWVCGVGEFVESHCLEVMGTGSEICHVCFLVVTYPYCISLGTCVSFARVCFVVYISIIVLARGVVP